MAAAGTAVPTPVLRDKLRLGRGKARALASCSLNMASDSSPAIPACLLDTSILRDMRVLLVDDSTDSLDAFCTMLELEGARVLAAASAVEGSALAREHDFDLILSDIGMPEMNGYEFITELRKASRNAAAPAIALTGFGREQDAVKALRASFHAHLGKPVSLPSLINAVRIRARSDRKT